MKKSILLAVILIAIAGLAYFVWQENGKTSGKSTKESITELISQKYNRPLDSVIIEVRQDAGTFAKGTVSYANESGGGLWFAAKTSQGWELASDGNGIVACGDIAEYNFPKDMIPQCLDTQNGNRLIER